MEQLGVPYAATLENNLVVSLKMKHTNTMWPSHSTYKHLPRRNENIVYTKTVHGCSQHLCNSWKLGPTHRSGRWTAKCLRCSHMAEDWSAAERQELWNVQKLRPHSAGSLTVLAPLSRILHFRGDAQKLGLLVYSHTFIFALEFSLKGKTAKKKKLILFIVNKHM